MNTKQKLSLMARVLTSQVNKTKQLATNQQPGIATPQMVRTINSISDAVPMLSKGTDSLTVSPGYYFAMTSATANLPADVGDTGDYAYFLSVTQYSNGDRFLSATQIVSGKIFTRVVPHNTTGLLFPHVWQRTATESLLWKGAVSPTDGTTFELVDSVKNYDGLIIRYTCKNIYGESKTVTKPAVVSLGVSNMTTGVPMMEFFEIDLSMTSETVYTVSHNQRVVASLNGGTATADGDVSAVIVTSISGVR